MARVSVVMATYNGEKYIEKQLLSLLAQTRPADEVVICDDASDDRTPRIVGDFIARHGLNSWQLHVYERNAGYAGNFYRAIGKSTGNLVALCDQDDVWLEKKLEVLCRIFDEHPQIRAINTGFTVIDGDDRPVALRRLRGRSNNNLIRCPLPPGALARIVPDARNRYALLAYNISLGCTMAFTREVREIYLAGSDRRIPHDWELNIVAWSLQGLYFYNEPLIRYRIHDRNTIGLHLGMPAARSASLAGNRLAPQKGLEGALEAVERYGHGDCPLSAEELREYAACRRRALEKGSLRDWLGLWRYRGIYRRMISAKGMLADLAAVLSSRGR